MLKEFKAFALRGNVIDMAVGIIIGVAFSGIVSSLVADMLMPPIGLVVGYDFTNLFLTLKHGAQAGPYMTLADAKKAAAVTLNYGVFINAVVNFLIVAVSMFILISIVRKLWADSPPPAAPATKECPFCLSTVPAKATRCGHCTSNIA